MRDLLRKLCSSEIFVYNLEIKSSRVLWISIGSFLTYNYFTGYLKMNEVRKLIFQRNFQKFHGKYQQEHFSAAKSNVDIQGFPDQGDWLYSKEIPETDLKELLTYKEVCEEKRNEFCLVMPLYIISGLWTPFITSCLGGSLLVMNWRIDKGSQKEQIQNYKTYIIYGLIFNAFLSSVGLKFY